LQPFTGNGDVSVEVEESKYQAGITGGNFRFYTRLSVSPFTVFSGLFSEMCAAIALKLCTWLYIYDIQIKFEDDCYWLIFGRVMALELSHFKEFYSFLHVFFSLLTDLLFIWYLVHCFAILRYRSSLSLVSIHWFFPKL
jgi:hypothetical protein